MADSAPDSSTPVFVVGFQRSGTTLLQSMLGAHPAIAAPPETHFVFRIAMLSHFYGDLADDANLRRVLHDTLHPPVPLLADLGLDEDLVYERLRAGPRSYASVLDVVMSEIAALWGKRRWSDKSPGQHVGSVLGLFPNAQVVHILRDPRDVIASSLETPWTPGSARQLAREWRRFTLGCLRAGLEAGPRRYLLIRYEDLVTDPEVILRRVCQFLGEDFNRSMLDADERRRAGTVSSLAAPWQARALEQVSPDRRGRHKLTLTRWQQASVAAVLHREMAALGYEPVRRRKVFVGTLLNAGRAGEDLPGVVHGARLRRNFTPARHYEEVQRFLERGRQATSADHG